MRLAISWALAAVWLAAGAWSVTLARADAAWRSGTAEGLARAMEWIPQDVSLLKEAALRAEYEGNDAGPLWERVAQLVPTASAPRLRLGLLAEQRGDAAGAERWLREAYAVDRQFETRWTLANFFLRQNRPEEFWTWIHSALEISYGDRRPAFELCWRMSADAREILDRAIPEREEAASAYLYFLLDTRRTEALAAAARKTRDRGALLAVTDALLAAGRFREATEVWRHLGRAAPAGITGPRFEAPRSGQGFDWREVRGEGVSHLPLDGGRGHRIRLTGAQAESADLLRQYVGGLRPGARYRVEWDASGWVAGLTWLVDGREAAEFVAPAEVVLLTLRYRRPVGEVRAEGAIDLHRVSLSTAQ